MHLLQKINELYNVMQRVYLFVQLASCEKKAKYFVSSTAKKREEVGKKRENKECASSIRRADTFDCTSREFVSSIVYFYYLKCIPNNSFPFSLVQVHISRVFNRYNTSVNIGTYTCSQLEYEKPTLLHRHES